MSLNWCFCDVAVIVVDSLVSACYDVPQTSYNSPNPLLQSCDIFYDVVGYDMRQKLAYNM
jgi:hypothetical protein